MDTHQCITNEFSYYLIITLYNKVNFAEQMCVRHFEFNFAFQFVRQHFTLNFVKGLGRDMSQEVLLSILLLTFAFFINFLNVSNSGRILTRNRSCNLLLPPDAITYSYIVSQRSECLAIIAPLKEACCIIYDYTTRNCTVGLTDRFQLVPNASASLEVGIDSE